MLGLPMGWLPRTTTLLEITSNGKTPVLIDGDGQKYIEWAPFCAIWQHNLQLGYSCQMPLEACRFDKWAEWAKINFVSHLILTYFGFICVYVAT